MSREIKFRAWDGSRMVRAHNLMLDTFNGRPYWQFGYQAPEPMESNTILMQFTGLKDKSGVEIFEGDIVRFSQPFDREDARRYGIDKDEQVSAVEWNGRQFVFYGCASNDDQKYWEVIGNIHQNPELLQPTGG